MVRELLEHHLLMDSRTVRTLGTLLFRPGALTRAYSEGKRIRFMPPLRLYMFSTIAFFLLLWVSGLAILQIRAIHEAPAAAGQSDDGEVFGPHTEFLFLERVQPTTVSVGSLSDRFAKVDLGKTPSALKDFIQRLVHGYDTLQQRPKALNPVFDEWLPRLFILLLPLATLGLALFGLGRGLYFVDHMAFALHGQSMAFILAIAAILLRLAIPSVPLGWPLAAIAILWTLAAYRTVYRSGWFGTVLKVGILGTTYVATLALGLLALTIWGITEIG